jgi:hypothetical protein
MIRKNKKERMKERAKVGDERKKENVKVEGGEPERKTNESK